jgi:dTDP-4-amino-4,6-dideoxygalactose transaminase
MKHLIRSRQCRSLPALEGGIPVRPAQRQLVFGAPTIGNCEVAAVSDCLRSGWIGKGQRVAQFEQEFASFKGSPYAVAVSSGTAALHVSLIALGVGTNDEVIAPAMTFASTVNAIVHAGATPVLADCNRSTFNMELQDIESKVTSRTKAIIVVHMCGRSVEMDPIVTFARKRHIALIEDCAHAIESSYHGIPAGMLGDVGCFSFYATKNITTGDGGMVITKDRRLFRKIRLLSDHGLSADAWTRARHRYTTYYVMAPGFKYAMTDLEAALGLAQLANIEKWWEQRQRIWNAYNDRLSHLPVMIPGLPDPSTRHAYHLYTPLLALESLRVGRTRIIDALRAENIGVGVHYVPVHVQPYYQKRFGFRPSDLPNAALIGGRTISLPLSPALTAQDVADVCTALHRILSYYERTDT